MAQYLFHGGRLLDPQRDALIDGVEVLVENEHIKEVADRPIRSAAATRIDLDGRTLMPGLIDAHIHLFLAEVNLQLLQGVPLTLLAAKASVLARAVLMRGFTTVRDTGGADFGMRAALESGLFEGPRLYISGAPISQTGGHADFRHRTQTAYECPCCSGVAYVARIADGVPEVIKAVRDELRKGADQIKIMVSGGVASPSDPLESLQFRVDEIEAAVEEASRWGTYVCAHAILRRPIRTSFTRPIRAAEGAKIGCITCAISHLGVFLADGAEEISGSTPTVRDRLAVVVGDDLVGLRHQVAPLEHDVQVAVEVELKAEIFPIRSPYRGRGWCC